MPSETPLVRRRARHGGLILLAAVAAAATPVGPTVVADEPPPADVVTALSNVLTDRSAVAARTAARQVVPAATDPAAANRASSDGSDAAHADVPVQSEAPEPDPRQLIAARCPELHDPEILRDGAALDGHGLCVRSVLEARSDTAAAAIVEGFGRLGLPYSRGRRSGVGYDDCSSFVGKSYRQAGRPLSDTDWEPSSSAMRNAGWAEVVDEPLPGDILWRRGHVAMALADGFMMHASQSGDVTHVRTAGRYRRVLAVTEPPTAPATPAPPAPGPPAPPAPGTPARPAPGTPARPAPGTPAPAADVAATPAVPPVTPPAAAG